MVCALVPRAATAQSVSPPTLTLSDAALLAASLQQPQVTPPVGPQSRQRTDVAGAIGDSFKLLMIEHAMRIAFQEKTRRELAGRSGTTTAGRSQGPTSGTTATRWFINYIGHPIHGAAAGVLWLDHDRAGAGAELGLSSRLLEVAGRGPLSGPPPTALQFEFGPLSEASIGNVGMQPGTTGWVDHVVTPVGALAMTVAEDALDRYVMLVEGRTRHSVLRASMRVLLNPARALSNGATGRPPWHRAARPIGWR